MEKIQRLLPWFLGIIFVINLLVVDFVWISPFTTPKTTPTPYPFLTPSSEGKCPDSCLALIEDEVFRVVSSIPKQEVTVTPAPIPTPAKQAFSVLKVVYVPIDSSGSTSETSWADISGTDFYFDLANYPGAKAVRWEISLQSYLSSNPAYIRIYDVTNKRAIDGSELTTRSSSYDYLRSGNLTIWRGENLYRIQAKGSAGNVVNFNSPRLKIILE